MVIEGKNILEIAPEAFKGELSTEDQKAIEDFKEGFDWDGDKEPDESKKKPEGSESDDAEETKKPDDKKPEDETPSGEAKKEEDESKKTDDDQKPKEDDDQKPKEETEEEKLRKIAEEEGITVDEAKELVQKDKSVVERHGNDPLKIARALRKEQSQYGKLKSEHDKLVQFKTEIEAKQVRFQEETFIQKCEANREKLIDVYVKRHPDEDDQSEEVLFERAKVEAREVMKAKDAEYTQKIEQQATEKIEKLISELPEPFKELAPEIKEVANSVDRNDVLKDAFDIMHIAYWARGKKYSPEYVDSLIKDAEKRAKEEPRIKEKSTGPSSDRGASRQVSVQLTEAQKERAREIYSKNEDWSEEKMFSEYIKNHKDKDSWD